MVAVIANSTFVFILLFSQLMIFILPYYINDGYGIIQSLKYAWYDISCKKGITIFMKTFIIFSAMFFLPLKFLRFLQITYVGTEGLIPIFSNLGINLFLSFLFFRSIALLIRYCYDKYVFLVQY
jgi:hypothetical protein